MSIATFVKGLARQGIELYPNGTQLGCRAPEGALTSQLIGQLRTHKQELLDYFDEVEVHPLSYTQQGLWFELQLAPENTHYHVTHLIRLYSVVDLALLQQTFQMLVNRHSILRTTISESDGQPRLQLHHYQSVAFTQIDASRWSWDEIQAQVQAYHEAAFDLSERSFSVFLFTKAPDEHLLLIKMHHLFLDGWSMSIMHAELRDLYLAAKSQRVATLPVVESTYADYVAWQQAMLQEQGEALRSYWCKQLDGELPILNLPTDYPYQQTSRQKTEKHAFEIPRQAGQAKNLLQSLRTFARQEGVTLSTLLLAGYHILLHRYSGQDDILVGSIMAGRSREEFEPLLGYFLSPVVMRAKFTHDLTVQTFLQQFNQTVIGALNHQDYPLPLLVEALNAPHIPGRPPLYQAVFNMQRMPSEKDDVIGLEQLAAMKPTQNWDGLRLSSFTGIQNADSLDLTLHITEFTHRLQVGFDYNANLFKASTIKRMASHFAVLLNSIVSHPDQPVQQLPMLTEAEYHQIVHQWNDTAVCIPPQTIHALFEAQVRQTPLAVALLFGDEQLTYHELNLRANQLAHYLQAQGVGADVLVGICIERSVEMVVGMLGILKAGGAYLPLDPSVPGERLAFMLEDAQVSLVLTEEKLIESLSEQAVELFSLDSYLPTIALQSSKNPPNQLGPDSLAYVIYTSGSTGRPKGVMVPHRGINRLVNKTNYIEIRASDRMAQASNASFDAATFEIWGALLHGACLVGIPHEVVISPPSLATYLVRQDISILFLTTALFNQVVSLAPDAFSNLRYLLFGGEAVDPVSVRKLLRHASVANYGAPEHFLHVYGPTENTTYSSWYPIKSVAENAITVPIGRAIANSQIYILDGQFKPVPVGVPGELYLAGSGLALGYLNRPKLTQQSFIPNPFGRGKLYKTGDLCRWLPDGNIEFIGRTDFQVKIRGFRIELGEIESALRGCDGVREAVVLAREDNPDDKRLVAYVVGDADSDFDTDTLRQYLAQRLPDYMVPSAFVRLDAMPLTPNGKIDRRALPAPDTSRRLESAQLLLPRTPLETILAAIWQELLRIEQVGIHENFFEIGGHSLLATQVISRMRQAFPLELALRILFEQPTIAQLAAQIEELLYAKLEELSEEEALHLVAQMEGSYES